ASSVSMKPSAGQRDDRPGSSARRRTDAPFAMSSMMKVIYDRCTWGPTAAADAGLILACVGLALDHQLGLGHYRGQPPVAARDARLPDHGGAAAMQRRALGVRGVAH